MINFVCKNGYYGCRNFAMDADSFCWWCLQNEKLKHENERLEKALEVVCTQIAVHKPHCPGKLYLSSWPECEKCPRDAVCCDDWKQWALEKAEQALEGSDK